MTGKYFVGRQNKKSRRAAKQCATVKSSPQGKYFVKNKRISFCATEASNYTARKWPRHKQKASSTDVEEAFLLGHKDSNPE